MNSFSNLHSAIVLICFVALTNTSAAKVQIRQLKSASVGDHTKINSHSVRELENRLRPFLQARMNYRNYGKTFSVQQLPDEKSLFLVAKNWDKLSPEFKALYKAATEIPSGYSYYISPGGHFEIYYAKSGPDSVNITDTIGFGTPGNWRPKDHTSNKIPDYIDEVAWACDSAWSMEIDRFKYHTPYPYQDPQHPSSRMKIVVCSQGVGFYGRTFSEDHSDSTKGFSSIIELNNDWSDRSWSSLGYNIHPENAVHITCVHEFFHTIQYAMCGQIVDDYVPDDYPVSWVEGTAVLREHQGFDNVKDYLQYTSDFFSNPQMPFLSDTVPDIYTNALFTIFLAQFYSVSDSDDFIRRVFFTDYQKMLPFSENLTQNSEGMSTQWVNILNDFDTRSYFTGTRSHSGYFLDDASLMSQWSWTQASLDNTGTAQMQVAPYGMQIFAITPYQAQGDTLSVSFKGETVPQDLLSNNSTWAASYILQRTSGDTFGKIPVVSNVGKIEIPGWKSSNGILVIASNGNDSIARTATVSFQTCPLTYVPGSYSFNAGTSNDTAFVTLKAQNSLRCSLSVKPVQIDSLLESAKNNHLVAVTSFYDLSFPAFWSSDAAISLNIDAPAGLYSNTSNLSLYEWSSTDAKWTKIQDTVSLLNKTELRFAAAINQPGIYAAFASSVINTQISLTVYPNPAHSRSGGLMYFMGPKINDIQIFAVNGSLVCQAGDNRPQSNALHLNSFQYEWNLKNNSNKNIAPGIYFAIVKYSQPGFSTQKTTCRNLMILP